MMMMMMMMMMIMMMMVKVVVVMRATFFFYKLFFLHAIHSQQTRTHVCTDTHIHARVRRAQQANYRGMVMMMMIVI